jgi:hypothetical protein
MVTDDIIYQEIWPWGCMIHLKLTSRSFATSIYKSFLPLTTIPLANIRHVEIGRLGLSKMMTISYYKNSDTFVTSSFPVSAMDAWRRAFQSVGITVD